MTLFAIGLLLVLAGGGAALLGTKHPRGADRAFIIGVVTGCAFMAAPAISVLSGATTRSARVGSTLPGGDWVFGIDPLSALLLMVILLPGVASAVFGTGYFAHGSPSAPRAAGASWSLALFSVELAALSLVVTAQAVMPFLIAWEVMAVAAYLLIVLDHHRSDVRSAGLLYLVAAHIGVLALMAMFAAWGAGASDWSFETLASTGAGLGGKRTVVLSLALLGFGLKAGLVPLHFWLPSAHAAAPTYVSAMLSGVVLKTGIYGLLRVVVLLGGGSPAWWGWTVVGLGLTSGILGVVWALAQHDIKRLLAYHSVENIGIILLGIGLGVLGAAYDHPGVALLGFTGAALHTLNHGLFKSLLFLAAGVVYRLTGTRDIERLGGLAARLPRTWWAFALGSVAIVGLPPLNGFISEWTIYQAFFHAGSSPATLRVAVLGAAGLALIGGLALACFAKVGGVVFLGRPRDPSVARDPEGGRALLAPLGMLALACVAIGLLPVVAVQPALRVGAFMLAQGDIRGIPAAAQLNGDAWVVGAVSLGMLFLATSLWIAKRRRLSGRTTIGETWACGYPGVTPRMQYSASSLAAPLLDAFGPWSGTEVDRQEHHLKTTPRDPVLARLIWPVWQRVRAAATRIRPMQHGRLHLYVLYIIATLVGLLVYLAVSVPN